jgi:rRNA maturation protein Nop10
MDIADFETAKIHEKTEKCQKCGSVSKYSKPDYFFL